MLMASFSIPSSRPEIGRISIRSLSRLRRSSSNIARVVVARVETVKTLPGQVSRLPFNLCLTTRRSFNAQRSTHNVQRSIGGVRVGRSALDVRRSGFSSALGRVTGAWWPSRSSKPLSAGNGRGRFDSYPLRLSMFEGRRLRFEVAAQLPLKHHT
jgi:hypothetical protein